MRVIFINLYTQYNKDKKVYHPGTDAFFRFGMGSFVADECMKRGLEILFENWRMDLRIAITMEKDVDGIRCRIFPSRRVKWLGEYSSEMVKAFKEYAGRKDVVFHFMGMHNRIYHYYTRFIKKNKIIATHLGGSNPLWSFKNEHSIKAFANYMLEKWFLIRPYDHFFTMSRTEADYFAMLKKKVTLMPIFGIPMPETLEIRDRAEQRKRLGLPLNAKILLQVGRATKERGFEWIIDMLDQEMEEFFWVFVGIGEEDEFYPSLIKRNVWVKNYMLRTELVQYYNAADLLYYLPNGKMDLQFAGTSYVPIESMACGTPVIASTFHHFPGNEVKEVSMIPEKKDDVIPMIRQLLNKNISRERCREIAFKYFSWDYVINKYSEQYTHC